MKTILVVDDDREYRELLTEELKEAGFATLSADNGEIALHVVQTNTVDLILLDLLMPKVDGTSFYFQLKNVLKKHIPVIVLTNIANTVAYDENIKQILIKSNVTLGDVINDVKKYI